MKTWFKLSRKYLFALVCLQLAFVSACKKSPEGQSGERFGTERLEVSLRAARNKPAGEIISSLYEDVLRFAGGTRQMDDLTAIVVKRV